MSTTVETTKALTLATTVVCTMYIELDICGYPIALQKNVAKSVVMKDH